MKPQKHLVLESHSLILFFTLFVLYAVVYMTKNMYSSAMAVIVEQGVMTKSQTGFINAVYWFIYGIFQFVGGFITDKTSPFKVVTIGVVGAALANIIISINQNYYVMLAAWAFNGMIQFGVWPGIFKIISTQTDSSVRGPAVLWISLSSGLGLGMSMLVASFVKRWQNNFSISAIVLLVMLAIFIVVYRRLEKEMVEDTVERKKASDTPTEKAPMLPLLFSTGLIALIGASFFRFTVENGIKLMTPVMLMESYENLPAAISTRMSAVLVIFTIGGLFIARYARKKIKYETSAMKLFGLLAVPGLAFACFVGRVHYIWILVALSYVTIVLCATSPFAATYISTRFEKQGRIGTVTGVINGAASLGNILASYVFAKMAELVPWEWVTASWLAFDLIFVLLCVIVAPRWKRFVDGNE